jgi:hypothetical protein
MTTVEEGKVAAGELPATKRLVSAMTTVASTLTPGALPLPCVYDGLCVTTARWVRCSMKDVLNACMERLLVRIVGTHAQSAIQAAPAKFEAE